MITITTNVKSLQTFLHNAKTNIMRSQTELAKKLTDYGYDYMRNKAPSWRGGLKNSIAKKIFPNTHKGEIFVAGDFNIQQQALANEFGLKRPMLLFRSENQLLDEWALEKGYLHYQDPDWVVVGGRGTHLGRQNKFVEPTFMQIQKMIPSVAESVIGKAVLRTKG